MLYITASSKSFQIAFGQDRGPVELGRGPKRAVPRLIVQDPYVSKDQLRVEELSCGRVRLENLSRKIPVVLQDALLAPGESREADLPVRMSLGETLIEITAGDDDQSAVGANALQTVPPPLDRGRLPVPVPFAELSDVPRAEELVRWFETVVAVQQSAASSTDFHARTARAVVELVGLDRGLVLLRRDGGWEIAARHATGTARGSELSSTILDRVLTERRTFYRAAVEVGAAESLKGIAAVVAAPILGPDDRLLGVVYGTRFQVDGNPPAAIRPLEAQLVQVLAAAVGAGWSRIESETEAIRRRVQFEQFFTVELARELDRNPAALDGQQREVTILFADIRGFSRISEKIDPFNTCRLVGDVMQQLTARIREFDGALIDYVGDGLLAMWNAPLDQPDHAALACRAAIAMLGELSGLDQRWRETAGAPIRLGIGLNTGVASVGNTGSLSKFKYGPLGHTVNLASRVEGATKLLGVQALVTGTTFARLGEPLATRRLCRARVSGIEGAVDLYELSPNPLDDQWTSFRKTYEAGLDLFEAGNWAESCRALYPLIAGHDGHYDPPTLTLIGRSLECLKSPPATFDPVMSLGTK
jgi:adenylate cyclase